MRKSVQLDHLLENAVALALGLERPHRIVAKKVHADHKLPARRHHASPAQRNEHKVAA